MTDPIQFKGIQPFREIEISPQRLQAGSGEPKESFSDLLIRAVNGVDETMKESDQKMQDFVSGKTENVHDVMISMQRAQLSFQLMVEIRNKAIEAYQEISRMQI